MSRTHRSLAIEQEAKVETELVHKCVSNVAEDECRMFRESSSQLRDSEDGEQSLHAEQKEPAGRGRDVPRVWSTGESGVLVVVRRDAERRTSDSRLRVRSCRRRRSFTHSIDRQMPLSFRPISSRHVCSVDSSSSDCRLTHGSILSSPSLPLTCPTHRPGRFGVSSHTSMS